MTWGKCGSEVLCGYLQHLSAGQHTVLIGEGLTQMLKDAHAFSGTGRDGEFLKVQRDVVGKTVCSPAHGGPGLFEAIDGVGLQSGQDGPHRREVLQLSAFLWRRGDESHRYNRSFRSSTSHLWALTCAMVIHRSMMRARWAGLLCGQ